MKITNSFEYEKRRLDDKTKSYLNGFFSGNDTIDKYIKEKALSQSIFGEGVTYLIIDSKLNTLVACYILTTSAIFLSSSKKPLSSIEIKMFAVSIEYQDTLIKSENKIVSNIFLDSLVGEFYDDFRFIFLEK